jgi:hypothetical protein
MLGIGLLVRLGRTLVAGPVADAGLLPTGYYRHLALEALEAADFPRALDYLKWAQDRLLTQMLILRLRLLADRHRRQRRALLDLLQTPLPPETAPKCRALLAQVDQALAILRDYETQALAELK